MNKFCTVLGIIILGIVNIYCGCCGSCKNRNNSNSKTEVPGKRGLRNPGPKLPPHKPIGKEEEHKDSGVNNDIDEELEVLMKKWDNKEIEKQRKILDSIQIYLKGMEMYANHLKES